MYEDGLHRRYSWDDILTLNKHSFGEFLDRIYLNEPDIHDTKGTLKM
jgi:hypothetical protein